MPQGAPKRTPQIADADDCSSSPTGARFLARVREAEDAASTEPIMSSTPWLLPVENIFGRGMWLSVSGAKG